MPPINAVRRATPLLVPTRTPEPTRSAKTVAPVILPKGDRYEPVKQPATAPVNPVTDPNDWHLPKLDEVFALAEQYPGKQIYLDIKLPPDNPQIAERMAAQLIALLRKYPDLKDRVVLGLPNKMDLDTLEAAFAREPDFAGFKNFTFDHEELNVVGFGDAPADATPLWGSGDNQYVSIGDPKTPGAKGNWDDLLRMSKDTLRQTNDPSNPNFGKKLIVWTVDDPAKIQQLSELGVYGIMTDNPDSANAILDKLYTRDDPKRPKVFCHRGGPDDGFAPENTLPMVERGFRKGDAVEIDIVSCKDGVVLFHDNDASGTVGTVRNLGLEGMAFRPTNPGIFSKLRGVPADELTIEQLRSGYGYTKTWPSAPFQSSGSPLIRGLGKVLGAIHVGALALLRGLEGLGLLALAGVKAVGSWLGKLFKGAAHAVTSVVKSVGHAVGSVLKSVGGFFKGLFGKKHAAPSPKPPRPPKPVVVAAGKARRVPVSALGVSGAVGGVRRATAAGTQAAYGASGFD